MESTLEMTQKNGSLKPSVTLLSIMENATISQLNKTLTGKLINSMTLDSKPLNSFMMS